jgi:hypothetical protein
LKTGSFAEYKLMYFFLLRGWRKTQKEEKSTTAERFETTKKNKKNLKTLMGRRICAHSFTIIAARILRMRMTKFVTTKMQSQRSSCHVNSLFLGVPFTLIKFFPPVFARRGINKYKYIRIDLIKTFYFSHSPSNGT